MILPPDDGDTGLAHLLRLARWLDPQLSPDAGHSLRVGRIAGEIADAAGFDGDIVALASIGGVLHDVGKVVVPPAVLAKVGRLDAQEFEAVKQHPAAGGALAERAELGLLAPALRHHHERWDGGGYPDGLAGHEIPTVARILAIADAYEAMLAARPYRSAFDLGHARRELERGAGTQFDPALVEAFLRGVSRPVAATAFAA